MNRSVIQYLSEAENEDYKKPTSNFVTAMKRFKKSFSLKPNKGPYTPTKDYKKLPKTK